MPYQRKTNRPYKKRNKDYWKEKESSKVTFSEISQANNNLIDFEPVSTDDSWFESTAATSISSDGNVKYRQNRAALFDKHFKYSSIYDLPTPMRQSSYGSDHYIDIRETVELVEKAYFNIPVFGATIDLLSEFADSEIFLEGGTKRSKAFFEAWLKTINIDNLKAQYFLEYFRGGNVFLYRLSGKIKRDKFKNFTESNLRLTDLDVEIPIRYVLMSPREMVADIATSYATPFFKQFLSSALIRKLKEPSNEHDKAIFDSLPEEAKKKIESNAYHSDGVHINLDHSRLLTSFYKKQDYEPFSVPMGFKVLDDLNAKLELKKIDQAISRTVENVILLITAGQKESDGGYDPRKLSALQGIFQNETVGRTLVSDYTTKAEFIIPDLKRVVGPEKYEILNQDIQDGLQNIIIGNENKSNTETKAKLFLKRLNQARKTFLNDVLIPEMKRVSNLMGFRDMPAPRFQQIDLKDEAQWGRIVTRMTELGVLTPELAMKSMRNGELPTGKEVDDAQAEYIEKRKDGKYNPLLGGIPFIMGPEAQKRMEDEDAGIPSSVSSSTPKQPYISSNKGQVGVSRASLEELVSVASIEEVNNEINSLYDFLSKEIKKSYGKKRLSKDQKNLVSQLTGRIVESTPMESWQVVAARCAEEPKEMLKLNTLLEIQDAQDQYDLEDKYAAAIVWHSKQLNL